MRLPSSAPTTTLSLGSREPERTMLASSLSTRRWMVRLKGRAPNSGSKPSSAIRSTASSVNSTSMSWALRRRVVLSRSRCAISPICSLSSARKTMISSMRLTNSGLKVYPHDLHHVFLELFEGLAPCGRGPESAQLPCWRS